MLRLQYGRMFGRTYLGRGGENRAEMRSGSLRNFLAADIGEEALSVKAVATEGSSVAGEAEALNTEANLLAAMLTALGGIISTRKQISALMNIFKGREATTQEFEI